MADSELAQLVLTLIIGQGILLLTTLFVCELANVGSWAVISLGMGSTNMRPEAA